ncbi:MAG: Holliday junction branch migration protein RuvA [Candidatus Omnitrophota bacterium]
MIAYISGKIRRKKQLSVIVDVGGISYEVMMPQAVMKGLDKAKAEDGAITLITYHYYQMDPSKAVPVLVGFLSEIEKEFFEHFITVSGVGPKAACRALIRPFSVIAAAIDRGDVAMLKTMPGIGEQRAREIIAKLQGKVGKFGLIRDGGDEPVPDAGRENIKEEAASLLVQLQYKRSEARDMVEAALKRNPEAANCEEILNEVYRGSKVKSNSR